MKFCESFFIFWQLCTVLFEAQCEFILRKYFYLLAQEWNVKTLIWQVSNFCLLQNFIAPWIKSRQRREAIKAFNPRQEYQLLHWNSYFLKNEWCIISCQPKVLFCPKLSNCIEIFYLTCCHFYVMFCYYVKI